MKAKMNHVILLVVVLAFGSGAAWRFNNAKLPSDTVHWEMVTPGIFQKDTCVDGKPDARIDDRHDFFAVQEHLHETPTKDRQAVIRNGEAVGMLFPCKAAYEAYLTNKLTHGEKETLDPKNPFAKQVVPPGESQTAFLIREDLIATAAHWPLGEQKKPCREGDPLIVAFGLAITDPEQIADNSWLESPAIKVFEITERVLWDFTLNKNDYAVYRLACSATGLAPLELDLETSAQHGDPIYSWGHPKGLPLKFVDDAQVVDRLGMARRFTCPLDAMPGSSGSPVFNARSHKVIGILSGGNTSDYTTTIPKQVVHNKYHRHGCKCPREQKYGTKLTRVFRLKAIAPQLNQVFQQAPNSPDCQ